MISFKNSNLFQAWLVLVLAILFGTALAAVQAALGPKIEENKLAETLERIPSLVLGEDAAQKLLLSGKALDILPRTMELDKEGVKKFYTLYDVYFQDGTNAGLVAKASGQGYADKIELLVGFDVQASSLTGLFILDQKETPGLGNKIIDKSWRDQFVSKPTSERLIVVKGRAGGKKEIDEIDAISGATISSRSVTAIVNTVVNDLKAAQNIPGAEPLDNTQVKGAVDG